MSIAWKDLFFSPTHEDDIRKIGAFGNTLSYNS